MRPPRARQNDPNTLGARHVARIIPQGWQELEVTGAAQREIETLGRLAAGLPPELTVVHGVHWTRLDHGTAAFGEIDFVIVAPSGRVLLIEQKSGFLSETADGLVKAYKGGEMRISVRLGRTLDALRRRLAPLAQEEALAIDYLLYCPDYSVRQPGTAGIPPERIVDAGRAGALCRNIVAAFPAEPARPALAARLVRFFADELQLVPDVSALVGRAEQLVTRLSGGLASWARRLEFEPFRLHVVGTAGSGKTQLAAALLHDAALAGRRALYICFNRPLADHLARVAPGRDQAMTFHQWSDRCLRRAGVAIDYAIPGAFAQIERQVAELPVSDGEHVDELVVDEGQDLAPAWREILLRRLAPGGRAWWLEDPMQNLYDRPPVESAGWVRLHADSNYRSPRAVLQVLDRLVRPPRPIEAASPLAGGAVEFLAFADSAGMVAATKRAVTLALQGGLRLADIALVTYTGRDKSRLLHLDRLGPHRLTAWTGRYDLYGVPQYSPGDLLIETVYRFKGQSAPCVILTEVDFEAIDGLAERKLFVGMTRAAIRLFVVLSERAARELAARAGDDGRVPLPSIVPAPH